MVKSHFLLAALSAIFALMILTSSAAAWTGTFHIEHEWVKIWINQNGTIDLFYNITLTLDSGDNITYVLVGQPNSYFTIGNATDQNSNTLYPTNASQGTDYKVKVPLHTPLKAGQSIWFTLLTNVDHMIYNDTKYNPGNLGMLFTPCWWSVTVKDLRVMIVLPPRVNASMVKTTEIYWNKTGTEDGCLTVYWEKQNLTPDEQKNYSVGVSFPQGYMPNYFTDEPPPEKKPSDGFLPYVVPFLFFGASFIFIIIVGAIAVSKKQYFMPKISMETLGIKHGLTAVEASYLLDMKPTQIVTEILYSLLKKRAVWVEAKKPAIKLRIMPQFQDKTGTHETPLRYYEMDFLNAIKEDGILDEEKLAETVMSIRDTVEEKMRGHCRRDTIDYYTKIVAKAWEQVEQAGTTELASNAYDEQLLWLLLDPNFQSRTQTTFQDRAFEPSPFWLWYWYGYQHYNPHPTYKPNVETPAQSAKPPTIPGADFANNIATAVEGTANNIVVNIEKFANAIIPMPTAKASNEPAHHGATCVCACASCACACACVSCACACASGGVG
jgi:hypothetical protein